MKLLKLITGIYSWPMKVCLSVSKTIFHIYWHEKCGQRCSLTLPVHHQQKQVVSQLPFTRFPHPLSFCCMSCFVHCLPVCFRRQTFDHPFTEDPDREDNFVEADTRPPIVIYLSDLYSRVLISWSDYWEGEYE